MKHVFLLGYPLGHSVSPAMHNAAFRAVGLDWRYDLIETPREKLPEVIAHLRADDCVGANVTIPHKEAVIALLDGVTDAARTIGAVNTIVKRDGKLIGENTDGYGFLQALRDANVDPRRARVVILGAGGAARAVAFALGGAGVASICILNRTQSRGDALANSLHAHFPRLVLGVDAIANVKHADIIVNATSVGMPPRVDESPVPCDVDFPQGALVFDLVYRPMRTQFLREAERAGARTIGGLAMLAHQGAAAFELWTGREAPIGIMFDAAQRALRS